MKTKMKTGLMIVVCILLIAATAFTAVLLSNRDTSTTIENGLSAYELAVQYGYEGTIQQWLDSLNGKSAYEIAKESGYSGTEEQWVASLQAAVNSSGSAVKEASFSSGGDLLLTLSDGTVLNAGKAVGAAGSDGVSISAANINAEGQLLLSFSDGKTVNLDKVVGANGQDGIGVTSSEIDRDGNLVITYSNGQTAVLGNVLLGSKGEIGEKGDKGDKGDKGETGDTGAAGANGISIIHSEINTAGELVLTFSDSTQKNLGKIVGEKGNIGAAGQDGDDGISVTSAEINSLGELVLGYSNEQYSVLGKVVGAPGTQGAQGEKGDTGLGIQKTEINTRGELVVTYTNDQVANLGVVVGASIQGEKGDDGDDGVGIQEIAIVDGELSITLTNTAVLNLGSIQGPKGDPGEAGAVGATGRGIAAASVNDLGELIVDYTDESQENLGVITGEAGRNGNDGVSVSSAELTDDGQLKLNYSNNTSEIVGVVVGEKGEAGAKGDPGEAGAPGADGDDGIGITSAAINTQDELVLTFSDYSVVNLGKVKGEKGDPGEAGQDGVGIAEVKVENGLLYIRYTGSEELIELGNVMGKDGIGVAQVYVQDGYLYIRMTNEDTATRLDYIKGDRGDDGETPYIKDGYWWIGDTNTNVKAAGTDGVDGVDGKDGEDGVSVINARINAQMHLILMLSNGREIDAGYVGIPADGDSSEIDPYTAISTIHASSEAMSDLLVKGRVVATGQTGFLVYDGTGYIFYYTGNTSHNLSIQDTVEISGNTTLYGTSSTHQFSNSLASYTVDDTLDVAANGTLTPKKWTASDVESYTAGTGEYIQIDLQLYKSGNYYNTAALTEDATKLISLLPPSEDVLGNLEITSTPMDVTVTGYILYCTANKYVYLVADSIVPQTGEEGDAYTLSLTTSFGGTDIEKYSTGNYGGYTYNDVDFEYYRAYRESDAHLMQLMPLETVTGYETLPGSLYNVEPIYGIDSIEIAYQSTSDSYLYTGDDRVSTMTSYEIPASASGQTLTFPVDVDNFFVISCGESDLQIINLTITYSNEVVDYDDSQLTSGTDGYRLNPTVYTGTLVDGESTVTVPTQVSYAGGQYVVTASKEYTYYSYAYIESNPALAAEAAMTDPADVINYYQAFGEFPANYVAKQFTDGKTPTDFEAAQLLFGADTRYVSRYSRTDGYALHVPYSTHNSATPYYYEFDIALEASYWENGSRGVGRVVAWEDGWTGTGYDTSPVCVYTDDHYQTFQEYLNTGYFSVRFDAEALRMNTVWSEPAVVTAPAA